MEYQAALVFLNTLATVSTGMVAVYFVTLSWAISMNKYIWAKNLIIRISIFGIVIEGLAMLLCFEYLIGFLDQTYGLTSFAAQLLFLAFLIGIIGPGLYAYRLFIHYTKSGMSLGPPQ